MTQKVKEDVTKLTIEGKTETQPVQKWGNWLKSYAESGAEVHKMEKVKNGSAERRLQNNQIM